MNMNSGDETVDDETVDDESVVDEIDEAFAQALRDDLSQLAQQSPAGPSAEVVLSAVRHRQLQRRRWMLVGSSLAAAMLLIVVTLVRNYSMQNHSEKSSPESSPMARGERDVAPGTGSIAADVADKTNHVSDGHATSSVHGDRVLSSTGWNLAPIASSIDLMGAVASAGDDGAWNVSLSLTLASAAHSENALQVMELSSPRW